MKDFRPTLYQRYGRWASTATADGTSECEAKSTAIRRRMATLYPHKKPGPEWWRRLWRKWQASWDPRIIPT